jgi:hypothetical protein
MQSVEIYIYVDGVGNRIELFNDEKISVVSSVQNFNDIGKLFTDYSQSFTIPASKHNNAIFKHWYESAIGETDLDAPQNVNGAFDHRIKYFGFIEINTIPFRDGKFTMDKANKKNGFIESYTINFVGNLVQLKDKFLERKLNSLQGYNDLDFNYNLDTVFGRCVGTTTHDVYFPLIGSNRRFEYDTGDTVNDIALLTGAINFRSLFPAIRVTKIFEFIQETFGLTFTGAFLNSQTFSELYLYCKNTEEMYLTTTLVQPVLETTGGVDLPNNTLTVNYAANYLRTTPPPPINFNVLRQQVFVQITTTSTNYDIFIRNNGELYTQFLGLSGNSYLQIFDRLGFFNDTFNFTFFITTHDVVPVSFNYDVIKIFTSTTPFIAQHQEVYVSSGVTLPTLNIESYVPDLTVDDFVTALVKMFNMVIIPINETTFEFIPLELWYQNGNVIDITKFIHANEIEIGKPKLFKKIDFKHEKSENILNNIYRGITNKEYGDLFFENPNSAFTENYEVKTPFEDVMWERTTGTEFLTATMWDKDQNPYTPKPVLMYNNGQTDLGAYWYINDGPADYRGVFTYRRFSNEIQLAGTDLSYLQTLNWGVENSVWNLSFAPNGLYQQFYSNYINNLYNQLTRVLKVKGNFNPYLLSSLKLNDRVIVSNKRYIINTLTTDLTTGEVELELLNDFRDITQNTIYLRYSNIPLLQVDNTAQVVQFIIYRNNYDTFDVKLSTDFLSYTLSTDNDADILLDVTIPANATAADRSDFVILEYFENGVGTIIEIPVIQYA